MQKEIRAEPRQRVETIRGSRQLETVMDQQRLAKDERAS